MSATRAGVEGLPIGATVDLGGRELKILRLLSEGGATGIVYAGELGPDGQQVAVKVMRGGDVKDDVKRFVQERVTLATLGPVAEQLGNEYGIGWKVVPHYHGKGSYKGSELFAMEFVAGDPVPDLLARSGKLGEEQALTIAWQLFFVLEVLHTREKQTYIDLKFENLRWVAGTDGAGGQLKMLDFGTLEKIDPGDLHNRGVRRDLLLASCYLCAMLTGEMPDYSAAGLKKPADKLISGGDMSPGVRHLLSKLLHRNPAVRSATAADVFQELWELVNYWSLPEADVVAYARTQLDEAEDDGGGDAENVQKHARKARSALDIVVRRMPEQAQNLAAEIARVEELLAASDYYARGRALFDGRAYLEAGRQFDLGRDWGTAPALFRRWSYLALAGQNIDTELFLLHSPDAIKVAEYLNAGKFSAARLRLQSLEPVVGEAGISALAADLEMFEQLERAEGLAGGDFEAAGHAFKNALRALRSLPDSAAVQAEVGDLSVRVEEMAELLATQGRARQLMADAHAALLRLEPAAAVEKASAAILGQSADPQRLADLLQLINVALGQLEYTLARELAVIGLFKAPDNGEVWRHFKFASRLAVAKAQVASGAENGSGRSIRAAYESFPMHKVAALAARNLRDLAFDAARQPGNYQLLRELVELSEAIGDAEWAADKRELAVRHEIEFQNRAQKAVDRLLSEANMWLLLVEPRVGGARRIASEWSIEELKQALQNPAEALRAARKAQQYAEAIAPAADYRAQEIAEVLSRIEKADAVANLRGPVDLDSADSEVLARLALHLELVRKLTAEWRSGQQLDDKRAGLAECAAEFFSFCERSGARSGETVAQVDAMRIKAEQLLQGGGLRAWRAVQEVVGGRIGQLQQEFVAAKNAFERGDLLLAGSEVQRLDAEFDMSEEWLELKSRVVKATIWKQWEETNAAKLNSGRVEPAVLKSLRGQLGEKLPAPYYSNVLVILQAAAEADRKGMRAALGAGDQDRQFDQLYRLVDVELTMRRVAE